MARDVAACTAMLEVLADGFTATTVGLDDLRVALAWADDATPGVQARVNEAAALFPGVERIEFPQAQGHTRVFTHEVGEVHRALYDEHADEYGEDVAWKLRELCFSVTDAELAEAERVRASFRDEAAQLLDGFDLLLTPTQGFVAPTYEEAANDALRTHITRYTNPFNALGWPALALPCGPAEEGLPASLQIVGRPGADALVLAAGAAVEMALLTH
jgi:Asp-tRNA(Asn)/Glu-tRNA(Gln) amidotransferase A subunit family amidase